MFFTRVFLNCILLILFSFLPLNNIQAQNFLYDQVKFGKEYNNEVLPYIESDNYKDAIPGLKKLAEKGHARSMYILAFLYFTGNQTNKDPENAIVLLKKSAELGHMGSQRALGQMYFTGEGVEQDYETSAEFYESSYSDPMQVGFLENYQKIYILSGNLGYSSGNFQDAALFYNSAHNENINEVYKDHLPQIEEYYASLNSGGELAYYLAEYFDENSDNEKRKKYLELAIKNKNDKSPKAYIEVANIFLEEDKWNKAYDAAYKALSQAGSYDAQEIIFKIYTDFNSPYKNSWSNFATDVKGNKYYYDKSTVVRDRENPRDYFVMIRITYSSNYNKPEEQIFAGVLNTDINKFIRLSANEIKNGRTTVYESHELESLDYSNDSAYNVLEEKLKSN